ncbi:MAG: 50S ribosomal protein L20 [Deferribacterota bacterium]|nr:50S ribosomal protein L20 [Deferribacterota bacterium]
MPRAKGGFKTRRRRKKWLSLTKGFRGAPNNVYRLSRQAAERAQASAYRGRKQKKRDYRRLWVIRLNAALREENISYSRFIHLLRQNNIDINRKALSELSINDNESFKALVKKVKSMD